MKTATMSEQWTAVDIETTGLNPWKDRILSVGFWDHSGDGKYFTDVKKAREYIKYLQALDYKFCAFNSKFDWTFLRVHGVVDEDFYFSFDPRNANPLIREKAGSNRLESMCAHYLGSYPWKDTVAHKNMEFEDPEILREYNLKDCEETFKLLLVTQDILKEEGQLDFYSNRLQPLDNLLATASLRGIKLDLDQVAAQEADYRARAEAKLADIRTKYSTQISAFEQVQLQAKLSGYKSDKGKAKAQANPPQMNLGSSKQLLNFLKNYMGVETRDRHGKPSTGDDAFFLASQHDIINDLLDWREFQKPLQFFTSWREHADIDGAIHTTFNIDVARTGRLSSSEPNLQQLPTRRDSGIRRCFVARDDHLFAIRDLSQIEPRMIAHYSQDKELLKIYRDGISLYGQVAVKLGLCEGDPNLLKGTDATLYNTAKELVLSILYGKGARGLSFTLRKKVGVEYSITDCRDLIDKFFREFSGIQKLREATTRRAEQKGYLKNLFGRHVFIPKEKAYQVSMNSLIQSSASDFMCFLQLRQQEYARQKGAHLVLLVHDQEIYEVPVDKAEKFDVYLDNQSKAFGVQLGLRVPITTEGGVYKDLSEGK